MSRELLSSIQSGQDLIYEGQNQTGPCLTHHSQVGNLGSSDTEHGAVRRGIVSKT